MGFDRRMLLLFVVLAVLGLPAFTLRVLCVGHACDEPVSATAEVPFCGLPAGLRGPVAAGFREGRSPDVLGVTRVSVGGGTAFGRKEAQPQWPSVQSTSRRVPLVLAGAGVPAGPLPAGTGLDDVAPTIASLIGIERPHPEVRSGELVHIATEAPGAPPLVVQIVWKGIGSTELERAPDAWAELRSLSERGSSTLEAEVPSLPMDPAAVLATIGTGGLPSQHGITGTLLRNDEGSVAEAWGPEAPVSVIAALGDDLDELSSQRALVGLVADDPADRGLIGKDWYVDTDRDEITIAGTADAARSVKTLLDEGFGDDEVPDLLAVSLAGSVGSMDRATGDIIGTVEKAVPGALFVVTGTGSPATSAGLRANEVGGQVDSLLEVGPGVVEATSPGGLFLDQQVLTDEQIAEDRVLKAMSQVVDDTGQKVFADVFPAIAVSFGRYC